MLTTAIHRPELVLVSTFAALIAVGTALLSLPVAQTNQPVSLVDTLFTATSAVCVTGLITVDTATAWSRFGQTVILVLFQLGGLGVMTFGALAAQLLHRRISFTSQVAWRSSFFGQEPRGDLRRALVRIAAITLAFETAGTGAIWYGMRAADLPGGVFDAAFHAVSAFCNAGFSVETENAIALRGSPWVLTTLALLIVAGGLGYMVWLEFLSRSWQRLRGAAPRSVSWSLQTRVILVTSGLLIVTGAVLLALLGLGGDEDTFLGRAGHGLFQSITARTAGFNTVDIGALPLASLLILIALMFIGGSPGSCAGGIKNTTFAVWLARIHARLRGWDDVNIAGRHVPHDIVRRAALVLALAALWNLLGVMVLTLLESPKGRLAFEHLIFEQVSAFATVGLSAGITAELSAPSKLWIIASMFIGRLGPLTIALAVLPTPPALYRYPAERVMVG